MKGYNYQTNHDNKQSLVDKLVLKSLPYGKWTTKDNKEFLFNRDYEPILGWDLTSNTSIPVTPMMWVDDQETKQEYFYDDGNPPTKNIKTLRKCWDILAYWSGRAND